MRCFKSAAGFATVDDAQGGGPFKESVAGVVVIGFSVDSRSTWDTCSTSRGAKA